VASIRSAVATDPKVSMAAVTLRRASTAGTILAVGTRAEAVIRVATLAVNITIDRGSVPQLSHSPAYFPSRCGSCVLKKNIPERLLALPTL